MTQRQLRRSMAKAVADEWRGKIGGICPRCKSEPLRGIESAEPAKLAICTACGWRTPIAVRILVMIRRPDQGDDAEAEGVIVVTDSQENAVLHCIRKGWVSGADRIQAHLIEKSALVPPTYIDRLLTPEELIALGDANAPKAQSA